MTYLTASSAVPCCQLLMAGGCSPDLRTPHGEVVLQDLQVHLTPLEGLVPHPSLLISVLITCRVMFRVTKHHSYLQVLQAPTSGNCFGAGQEGAAPWKHPRGMGSQFLRPIYKHPSLPVMATPCSVSELYPSQKHEHP